MHISIWTKLHKLLLNFYSPPITFLMLLLLTFIARGGYVQWTANRLILEWMHLALHSVPAHVTNISDIISVSDHLSASVSATFGKVSFARGNYAEAAAYYQRASVAMQTNPISLAELAIALSRTGQFDDVVALHKTKGNSFLWNQQARDAVAVAYLNQPADERCSLQEILSKLQTLAPESLYVKSMSLMAEAGVEQLSDLPVDARMQLARFPIEAVLPTDERLLHYAVRVIPDLVNSGIWDHDRLLRVIRLWRWEYPDSPVTAEILARLVSYDEMQLRQALLKEETSLLREQHDANTSWSPNVAAPPNKYGLLSNGGFDDVNYMGLVGWRVSDYIRHNAVGARRPAFVMGVDKALYVTPPHALRIDGLWDEDVSGFYGVVTFAREAGGTYTISLTPGVDYRLTGYYRTNGDSERASIYLGRPGTEFAEVWLSPTAGEWRSFEHTGCYMGDAVQAMQMIVRLWNKGSVWVDELSLQPVEPAVMSRECNP